jgi:hypothetical protein
VAADREVPDAGEPLVERDRTGVALQILKPLYCGGLWEAVIMTPAG